MEIGAFTPSSGRISSPAARPDLTFDAARPGRRLAASRRRSGCSFSAAPAVPGHVQNSHGFRVVHLYRRFALTQDKAPNLVAVHKPPTLAGGARSRGHEEWIGLIPTSARAKSPARTTLHVVPNARPRLASSQTYSTAAMGRSSVFFYASAENFSGTDKLALAAANVRLAIRCRRHGFMRT